AKWYSTSQTRASSYASKRSSTSEMTCDRRERIHRSTADSPSGSGPRVWAPFVRANRVAFHSLLQKLRDPAHHSSLTGTSAPGLAPRAMVHRVASAPYRSIQSIGSTTLPKDLDIFLPCLSRTIPCSATTWNGGTPSIAFSPLLIFRATRQNWLAYPVPSALDG